MSPEKRRIDVMVSSTTRDLGEHRERLARIISSFQFVPRMMDLDSTSGKDGIQYSLDLVDEAEIYILLLGFRYGYVPDDPRNPKRISITHMEYERALEREARGELCVLPFVMAEDHLLKHDHIEIDPENRRKLDEFRAAVLKKQVRFFSSITDLEQAVTQALGTSECVLRLQTRIGDDRPFEPREGELLEGRYVFQERLGQGGNGEVWRALERLPDGRSTCDVAIKLLKREISDKPQRIERFKKEISVARRLTHPHVLRTTHWGEIGNQFYAVMDHVTRQTLRHFMAGRTFSDAETVQYLGQVAEALNAAHKLGVVHRDVKPENILVQEGNLYLGDFGLAISPDEDMSISETGELVGTKKYMAPEQWHNLTPTPQTDVYALGIIAYEMLTGVFPYDESRLLSQHLNEPLPPHPKLPDEILMILHRATVKQPDQRYPSAGEFITDLAHWHLDPANLDTKIRKYLDTLRFKIKGEVYEQLFVDLEGDIRQILPPACQPQQPDSDADTYLDDLLRDFGITLDADHHAPKTEASFHVPNIINHLMQSERVVLVGEPGAGKSFTLRRLVMQYITRYQTGGRVPMFVPLNAFKGVDSNGKPQTFTAYINGQLDGLGAYYGQLLREDRLVLICDALNEMPRTASDGRNLLPEVCETLASAPLFIVSCRIRDYHNDLDSLKLERLEVRDMDLPAIYEFIQKYLRDDWQAFWERIGGSQDLFLYWREVCEHNEPERFWQENVGVPNYTTADGDNAWRRMWEGTKLIPLARNPYLARVICTLHRHQQIPSNRAELYQAFVTGLIDREQKYAAARGQNFPARERLEDFLTWLANQLQTGETTLLNRQQISEDDKLLQAALDANILLQEGDNLRFTHQLLQEYFAARTLALKMYANADPRPILGETWWQLNVWRETGLMLAEFTGDAEHVARWLGQASPELGVEIVLHYSLSAETCDSLIASAQSKTNEMNPIGRAAAYRVLGKFNADTRPGVGLRPDGLPDIDWVQILEGEFIYQDQQKFYLPSFHISRYPITYIQFQAFVDDLEGFRNPRWWQDLSADDNHKHQPGEQRFKFWNHPRENVSWYDAVAFCRWLSSKLGYEVTLPTEQQWEKAARGTDGRIYPYGNHFDAIKGNTSETGINQTCAVGIFPNSASPYGVMDMSGNIWEWCLNEYDNLKRMQLENSERCILRGGSWFNSSDLARAVYRIRLVLNGRNLNLGFRVVVVHSPINE